MPPRPRNFQCDRCGAAFPAQLKLARHRARKRPCDPVVAGPAGDGGGPCVCRHCGRGYSRPDALKRHVPRCAVAARPDGEELRLAHRLRAERAEAAEGLAARDARIAELERRLARQGGPDADESEPEDARMVNLMAFVVPLE